MEKEKRSTLQRTLWVLEYLAEHGKATASELIEGSGIPKSTLYLLLKELLQLGMIAMDEGGNYHLWVRLIALGQRAAAQLDVRDVSRPHLQALMERTGLLCHFGILSENAAYYILKIESKSSISVRSYEGKRLSLSRSGVGKCLLAWQPEKIREAIIADTDFTPVTPNTIASPEALRRELANIRRRGWGFDNGEDEPEVRCVAAPVFGASGKVAGAISVVGVSSQVEPVVDDLARQVMTCARDISKDIGWTDDRDGVR